MGVCVCFLDAAPARSVAISLASMTTPDAGFVFPSHPQFPYLSNATISLRIPSSFTPACIYQPSFFTPLVYGTGCYCFRRRNC
ncbi:hypothetical protein BKA80DRAFT_260050 [Phyllosticta citrichinensis]